MAQQDLTTLAAASLVEWINKGHLMDAAFGKPGKYGRTPYLDHLMAHNMDRPSSTKEFGCQIRTGKNHNFQYYSGYETWKTQPVKGFARAYFKSKQALISWSACSEELYYNGDGCEKMFDVLQNIKDVTTLSLREELNARLLNKNCPTISGATRPGSEFCDLESIIGDELSPMTTFGGINAVDCYWWRSLIKRPGQSLPRDWQSADGWVRDPDPNVIASGPYAGWQTLELYELDAFIECLSDCYSDGYTVFTTKKILLCLERLILARLGGAVAPLNGRLSVFNYTGINYRGVDFVADRCVPEGTMYFVHDEAIRFRPVANRWMTTRNEMTPHNQDAIYGTIFTWGEQYSCERRCLGKWEKVACK